MIKLKLSKKKINKLKKTKLLRKRNLRKSLRGGVNYQKLVEENPEVTTGKKNMKGRSVNQIPNLYESVGPPKMSQTNPFFEDTHKSTSYFFKPNTGTNNKPEHEFYTNIRASNSHYETYHPFIEEKEPDGPAIPPRKNKNSRQST